MEYEYVVRPRCGTLMLSGWPFVSPLPRVRALDVPNLSFLRPFPLVSPSLFFFSLFPSSPRERRRRFRIFVARRCDRRERERESSDIVRQTCEAENFAPDDGDSMRKFPSELANRRLVGRATARGFREPALDGESLQGRPGVIGRAQHTRTSWRVADHSCRISRRSYAANGIYT